MTFNLGHLASQSPKFGIRKLILTPKLSLVDLHRPWWQKLKYSGLLVNARGCLVVLRTAGSATMEASSWCWSQLVRIAERVRL